MDWCTHCNNKCSIYVDPDNKHICCTTCQNILTEDIYYKTDSSGQRRPSEDYIKISQHEISVPYIKFLKRGKDEISNIVSGLRISGGDSLIRHAFDFYQLVVDKDFTEGHMIPDIAAASLYLACRQREMNYLLIDFSDYLKINVYELGTVFLQLCQNLKCSERETVQNIVDPSLFIHRFTERLLGRKNNAVSDTALRLVASMKRDWMQTRKIPSGLCGAALYMSVHSHGLNYPKSNIVSVVDFCETILTRQLIEFEDSSDSNESSGSSSGWEPGSPPPSTPFESVTRLVKTHKAFRGQVINYKALEAMFTTSGSEVNDETQEPVFRFDDMEEEYNSESDGGDADDGLGDDK